MRLLAYACREGETGNNILTSPWACWHVIGIAGTGAEGETRDLIYQHLLNFGRDIALQAAMESLLATIRSYECRSSNTQTELAA